MRVTSHVHTHYEKRIGLSRQQRTETVKFNLGFNILHLTFASSNKNFGNKRFKWLLWYLGIDRHLLGLKILAEELGLFLS